jgi:hypothetical protein
MRAVLWILLFVMTSCGSKSSKSAALSIYDLGVLKVELVAGETDVYNPSNHSGNIIVNNGFQGQSVNWTRNPRDLFEATPGGIDSLGTAMQQILANMFSVERESITTEKIEGLSGRQAISFKFVADLPKSESAGLIYYTTFWCDDSDLQVVVGSFVEKMQYSKSLKELHFSTVTSATCVPSVISSALSSKGLLRFKGSESEWEKDETQSHVDWWWSNLTPDNTSSFVRRRANIEQLFSSKGVTCLAFANKQLELWEPIQFSVVSSKVIANSGMQCSIEYMGEVVIEGTKLSAKTRADILPCNDEWLRISQHSTIGLLADVKAKKLGGLWECG